MRAWGIQCGDLDVTARSILFLEILDPPTSGLLASVSCLAWDLPNCKDLANNFESASVARLGYESFSMGPACGVDGGVEKIEDMEREMYGGTRRAE